MPQTLYNKFYEKNAHILLTYIKNTNQKEILVKNIINRLSSSFRLDGQDFVFSDIGAGDGAVTIPVIDFLKDKTRLACHIIEPSDLMDIFKKNCALKNMTYYKEKVDEVKVAKSDFILASHVIFLLDDYEKTIKNLYASLKKDGILLIVETNKKSGDILLKMRSGQDFETLINFGWTDKMENFLKMNNIKYLIKVVSSDIVVSSCASLNAEGKAMISFFYHKPFEELTKGEIRGVLGAIKELAKNGKLIKKENYFWISK
jgi:16S rRNA G527 N7-methylase RsmG